MIQLLIGIILAISCFLALQKFENKTKGLFYIIINLIGFHLFLALITQALGIFNYSIILIANLLLAGVIIYKTDFKKIKLKINWFAIIIIIIVFIQLFSVHYNYAGEITKLNSGYTEVENFNYGYPYFSDEWVGIKMINYTISSGKLPLINPFTSEKHIFPNFELAFHSFGSEMVLFFGLNPLGSYVYLGIFAGILICLLVYYNLRLRKVNKYISLITALSIPYIINGANLPGIWTFIPLIMGIVCMLLFFIFRTLKEEKGILISSLLTLLFYPPLIIFLLFSFLIYKKRSFKFFLIVFGAASLLILLVYFAGFENIFERVWNAMYYPSFTPGGIPQFTMWKIIPIPIILFAILGILKKPQSKLWIIAPISIGIIYWITYSFVFWRFIIGYERVVVTTSFLITILAGIGIQDLVSFLKKNFENKKDFNKMVNTIFIIIIILFLVFSFSYTQKNDWKELKLKLKNGKEISPASPANAYLNEKDLELFKEIQNKKFLSHPWKGLVLGASTSNYPLHTKHSTITIETGDYFEFMDLNCIEKKNYVERFGIDYVYSNEINCQEFELIGQNSEGFYLYKLLNKPTDSR